MEYMDFSPVPEHAVYPTTAQLKMLLDKLEKNPEIAKGYMRHRSARLRARQFWQQMQLHLNRIKGGAVKTWKQWMKYWTDKKCATKKKAITQAANRLKNGGKADADLDLTDLEERIVTILGEEAFSMIEPRIKIPALQGLTDGHSNESLGHKLESLEAVFVDENTNDSIQSAERAGSKSPSLSDIISEQKPLIDRNFHPLRSPGQSPRRERSPGGSKRPRMSFPSERHSVFSQITERLMRLEERRMDIEENNASLLRAVLERTAQREHTLLEAFTNLGTRMMEQNSQQNIMIAEALKALGEGLKVLKDNRETNPKT